MVVMVVTVVVVGMMSIGEATKLVEGDSQGLTVLGNTSEPAPVAIR
jgi:hypothetical protein